MQKSNADVEIGLMDIAQFIRRNIVIFGICLLLGAVAGFAVFNYLPKQWEANVTIQIGKVPILGRFESIDSPSDVIEKIHSPSFVSKLLPKMYGSEMPADGFDIVQFLKNLKETSVAGSNLVVIRAYANNPSQAYKNVKVIADAVVNEHALMAKPYLASSINRLAEIDRELESSQAIVHETQQIDKKSPSKSPGEALLKLSLLSAKNSEIQKLQAERVQLQSLIAVSSQQATAVVASSLVPRAPVSPRLKLLALAGVLIGLTLGVLISLSKEFFECGKPRLK